MHVKVEHEDVKVELEDVHVKVECSMLPKPTQDYFENFLCSYDDIVAWDEQLR